MAIQPKTEEQLKTDIFAKYSQLRNEPSSDRRQVYVGQLSELIFRWCADYLYKKKTNEMGKEIIEALLRMTKENATIPVQEDDFFKYLSTVLHNAYVLSERNRVSGPIKIPPMLKEIEKVLKMEESYAGRELTKNERVRCVSKFFNVTEESAAKNLDLLKRKFESGLVVNSIDGEIDKLDDEKAKQPYMPTVSNAPQFEYMATHNSQIIRETAELVLQKKQDRTKDVYRELFTVHCLENVKDYTELLPVLDSKIIEAFEKTGEKPYQKEIYWKYHPNVTEDSAASSASQMSQTFLNDLYEAIKEKYLEIDLPKRKTGFKER